MCDENLTSVDRRRSLRQTSTKAEKLLWSVLRNRNIEGLKIRRQHSIGPFITDFVYLGEKLVIELDGGYHEHIQAQDAARQEYLEREGYRVLRFQNEDVLTNLEGVVICIRRTLGLPDEDSPSP